VHSKPLARTKEQKNWRHMQVCSAYKLVEYFNLDGVGIPCYVLFSLVRWNNISVVYVTNMS
jgi:hypothetical protein